MPNDIDSSAQGARDPQCFDEEYYLHGCGPDPYVRNEVWRSFYSGIVDHIVRSLAPRTVLDAGCALGMMVEAFWDRGVEASGLDISEYAIGNVRPDMRDHCWVASLADPIAGRYDLVTCIEVLEHIPPRAAVEAVRNISAVSDTLLFSSSPYDFDEVTHVNVRPVLSWISLFGQHGLWPDLLYDADFVLPHAMLLRRTEPPPEAAIVLFVEKLRLQHELTVARRHGQSLAASIASASSERAICEASARTLEARVQTLQGTVSELQSVKSALQDAEQATEAARAETIRCSVQNREERGRALAALTQEMQLALGAAQRQTAQAVAARNESAAALTAAMQENAEALRRKTAELEQLACRIAEKDSVAEALRQDLQRAAWATQRLAVIEASATWRTTAGLRAASAKLPVKIRSHLRRFAKIAWWLATPHRIPSRIRIRNGLLRRPPSLCGPETSAPIQIRERSDAAILAEPAPEPPASVAATSQPSALDRVVTSPLFDAAWYRERYRIDGESDADVAQHYVATGAAEGFDPGPQFSTSRYLARYPDVKSARMNALAHYEEYGRAAGLVISWSRVAVVTTADVLESSLGHIRPLPMFEVARGLRPRVTLVTDSTAASHFYGGVGTATVMAALWAKRRGATLSVATLRAEPVRESVGDLLHTLNIEAPPDVEFRRSDVFADQRPLDVGADDVFLTTSWWSTLNVLGSVSVDRLVYILQEDERMFYPAGDDQLRANEAMNTPGLRRVVNTRLLYDYLLTSGVEGLQTDGIWFEPAFPSSAYFRAPGRRETMNLFFYARPQNSRNLYLRGLEVLNQATLRGIIKADEWTIHFVGKDLQAVSMPGGHPVTLVENMSWSRYLDLLRTMDLGLSLMMTPHPSYPPLDLVACGAVAVTNAYGPKVSLASYSENLICAEPAVDVLVEAVARGVALARNDAAREANYQRQSLSRSWPDSLAPVLDWLESR